MLHRLIALTAILAASLTACDRSSEQTAAPSQPASTDAAQALAPTAQAAASQLTAFEMQPGGLYADDAATPQIIGGTKADPAAWPATFVFKNPQGGGCTSTVVGERVVITAAHCVDNGAHGKLSNAGKQISVLCQHHPDYGTVTAIQPGWEEKASPDFALCVLGEPLPGGVFERIDRDGKDIAKNKPVHLLGFGCNAEGGSDGGFGVLYEGDTKIESVPVPPKNYYTTTNTGAAVCYGDSGGGAYQYQNAAKTRRTLIAINSRGDISKVSLLSTTSLPGFVSWAQSWASTNNAKICGIHADASGCRPQ